MSEITYPPEMLPAPDLGDEADVMVLNCAYCGGPLRQHVIANGLNEIGEAFCSVACYDAHLLYGCPQERGSA